MVCSGNCEEFLSDALRSRSPRRRSPPAADAHAKRPRTPLSRQVVWPRAELEVYDSEDPANPPEVNSRSALL
jgi:hypothetical protein